MNKAIKEIIKEIAPASLEAFEKYNLKGEK